jgi:hypothetical protein
VNATIYPFAKAYHDYAKARERQLALLDSALAASSEEDSTAFATRATQAAPPGPTSPVEANAAADYQRHFAAALSNPAHIPRTRATPRRWSDPGPVGSERSPCPAPRRQGLSRAPGALPGSCPRNPAGVERLLRGQEPFPPRSPRAMAVLHLLGTGAAASDATRTTTMLAFEHRGSVVLVDCGGDVVQRALASGIDPESVEALIVTHEHPDHAGGFALFMERIWLLGRERPIPVIGIRPAIDQARRVLEAFDISGWSLPPIEWREVEHRAGAIVLENERWRITAAPGVHSCP